MPKPLVTYIKFLAPFPRVKGESDDAPGADLVRVISERLADLGIVISEVTRNGGWKWKIHARIGSVKVSTSVGVVDDFIPGPVNQWNAMHYSNLRLPWKLLPYSICRNRHIDDHEHYCKPFCEIVDSIDGLGDVIWYNTVSMGIRNAEATIG